MPDAERCFHPRRPFWKHICDQSSRSMPSQTVEKEGDASTGTCKLTFTATFWWHCVYTEPARLCSRSVAALTRTAKKCSHVGDETFLLKDVSPRGILANEQADTLAMAWLPWWPRCTGLARFSRSSTPDYGGACLRADYTHSWIKGRAALKEEVILQIRLPRGATSPGISCVHALIVGRSDNFLPLAL